MKCLNLHGIGDLKFDEKETPSFGDDEVLLKVKYCGVCGSDIGRVYSHGTYHFPTVIGHEFSGEVIKDNSIATFDRILDVTAINSNKPCPEIYQYGIDYLNQIYSIYSRYITPVVKAFA